MLQITPAMKVSNDETMTSSVMEACVVLLIHVCPSNTKFQIADIDKLISYLSSCLTERYLTAVTSDS